MIQAIRSTSARKAGGAAGGHSRCQPLESIPWVQVNSPCMICGSSKSLLKHVFKYSILPRRFELRRCEGCGLLFNSPRLSDLGALYEQDYYVFSETERDRYRRAIEQVKRHLDRALGARTGPLDILEVGSAKGHLLHVLRHLGHTVQGVEISAHACDAARRKFDVEVFSGSIEEYADLRAHQHDMVWCNDVIEHVPDPIGFVRACAAVLKPGGRLILDTPNGGAAAVAQGKANWRAYCPYHIFLFGAQNLTTIAEMAGLRVDMVVSYNNRYQASFGPSRLKQGLKAVVRRCLGRVGLAEPAKRMRDRLTTRDGELANRPMTGGEIDAALGDLPWYSDSLDARAELAEGCRGNNLCVHAVQALEGRR